jgi:release factor glutamine methyltransferase
MKMCNLKYKLDLILSEYYDNRECDNICAIYFEDRFGLKKYDFEINIEQYDIFLKDMELFKKNYPVQYITEKAWFYKSFFKIDSSVLIPRPETEELTELAIQKIKTSNAKKILDIGSGSGCIVLSIAKEIPETLCTALEISKDAINIIKKNIEFLNLQNAELVNADFLDESSWPHLDCYDIIVSNPPYIPLSEKNAMSESTIKYEPEIALYPEHDDDLIFYKKILKFAQSGHLKVNGVIMCEINEFASAKIHSWLQPLNIDYNLIKDMQGKDRILTLQRIIRTDKL